MSQLPPEKGGGQGGQRQHTDQGYPIVRTVGQANPPQTPRAQQEKGGVSRDSRRGRRKPSQTENSPPRGEPPGAGPSDRPAPPRLVGARPGLSGRPCPASPPQPRRRRTPGS